MAAELGHPGAHEATLEDVGRLRDYQRLGHWLPQ